MRNGPKIPMSNHGPKRVSDLGASWGRWWLALCLMASCFFAGKAVLQRTATPLQCQAASVVPSVPASRSIETIRVGQRVIAGNPEVESPVGNAPTAVDPATWRLLRLRAEDRWSDGTLDVIEVETLQPPQWIEENGARLGASVPPPVDLVEMGLPEDLEARVVADEPCPTILPGPGRVVLMTVNHLNRDVYQLTLVDQHGRREAIQPTGLHKFYSETRRAWISAKDLRDGEQLRGVSGVVTVAQRTPLAGVHRVYNFTVEDEHCYRVSTLGALVHNMCAERTPDAPRRPANRTPEGAGRSGAFRQAKADAGVPRSQQPSAVRTVPDRTNPGKTVREYEFSVPSKKDPVVIREDRNGHIFGPNDPQNRGPHFNTPDGGHYDY